MGRSPPRSSRKDKKSKYSSSPSRDRKDKKRNRSRSRDNYSRRKDRSRDRRGVGTGGNDRNNWRDDRGRGGHNDHQRKRDEFRFDSPPKDHELTKGIMAAAASMGGGSIANAHNIL